MRLAFPDDELVLVLVLVRVGAIFEGGNSICFSRGGEGGGGWSSSGACYYGEGGPGLTTPGLGFSPKIAPGKTRAIIARCSRTGVKERKKKKRGPTEILDVNKGLLSAGNLRWPRVRLGKSQARRRGIQPLRAPAMRREGGEKCRNETRKNTDLDVT